MMTNDYSPELIAPDELVLPREDYHRLYVKQSKIKHILFALFVVALLIMTGILLNNLR